MACIPFGTQTKKSKYITLLHRYIWVVLCMGAAVFGGEAGFRHHGKGGLVARVCRVVKVRDAQCCAIFWTFATTHLVSCMASPGKNSGLEIIPVSSIQKF
jgi:hypothetical protein